MKAFTLLCMCGILLFCSCKKKSDDQTDPTTQDNSLPSAAVIKVVKLAKNSSAVNFDIDFVVFKNKNTINTSLSSGNFSTPSFSNNGTTFQFTRNASGVQNGPNYGSYSACLLLDQSGSISTTDPNNDRIEAAKIFCQNLGSSDNMFLSAFASGGSSPYDLTVYGSGFTNNGSAYLPNLEALKNQIGGGTPLYKSAYTMIDYTKTNALNPNKALIVFTDGEDTDGSKTSSDVINRANAQGIKVFMVGLGAASQKELAGISNQTGGAFMFAQDARQLISMFGNLGKLLNGTATYYHTNWTVQSSTALPASGSLTNSIKVDLSNGNYIYVPFKLDF